jgi:prophage antirepressor-like protein
VTIDGAPWFVTTDVCKALGRGNTAMAVRPLSPDQKGFTTCATRGGLQTLSVVSESGLYLVIMRAQRIGEAKQFQDWVTREVLPAIRKDGAYVMGEEKVRIGEMTEDELLLKAMTILKTKTERLTAERDRHKAENATLERELNEVTVDEWRALNHLYLPPLEEGPDGSLRQRTRP